MNTISVCTEPGQKIIEKLASDAKFRAHQSFANLNILLFPWPDAWNELKKVALYKSEVQVSQVPLSGVGGLFSMDALHPFSMSEIELLGGPSVYHPLPWKAIRRLGEGQIYAIPWLLNPFGLLYWRDLLEKAKVEESTAFSSFENMVNTFEHLQTIGIESPWAHHTNSARSAMIAACMWIWAAGGDIISADGGSILFDQPAALKGLKAYFELSRFIKTDGKPAKDFIERQAAVMIGESSLSNNVKAADLCHLGVTTLPGPAFVGGSCLVVWKHAQKNRAGIDLIKLLLQKDILLEYCVHANDFPGRLDSLSQPPFSTDPYLKAFSSMLERGRTFPVVRASGILQTKFIDIVGQIWQARLAQPTKSLEHLFDEILMPEAARLNRLLAEY
jgi:multiple sugar transport system substrate-binding protein